MTDYSPNRKRLPEPVAEALRQGQFVQAFKLARASGIGLVEAKELIENYTRPSAVAAIDTPQASFGSPVSGGPLPATVVEALQQGNKLEAIKRMRAQTGIGLKEAKDAVDSHVHTNASSGLSPGQVPDSGGFAWVAVLAVIAIGGYFLFRQWA